MKRVLAIFLSVLAAALCLSLCACSAENSPPALFIFISVRIKGNGDGTITAVAQNEFSIGRGEVPASLKIYRSDVYQTNIADMEQIDGTNTDSLGFLKKLTATVEITDGYYCAVLEYTINNESNTVQSDTLHYNQNGKRI